MAEKITKEHPLFKDNLVCTSNVHCGTCRKKETGRSWRLSVFGYEKATGVPADFECPFGRKWDPDDKPTEKTEEQEKKMAGLGDLVAKVTSAVGIKPCAECKGRQEKLNKLVPFKKK